MELVLKDFVWHDEKEGEGHDSHDPRFPSLRVKNYDPFDKGNSMCFGPCKEDCYIENQKTGKRVPVKRKNDVFTMDLNVLPPPVFNELWAQRSGICWAHQIM